MRHSGSRLWRTLPLALLAVLFLGCARTGSLPKISPAEPALSPEQRDLNLQSFDMIFSTVAEKFFDPQIMGLDWDGIGAELRPQVAAALTMGAARKPMNELLQRLGQSHFVIYPGNIYDEATGNISDDDSVGRSHSGLPGDCGLEVRVRDGRALVTQVLGFSPAEALGIRPGWEILRIGSVKLGDRLAELKTFVGTGSMAGLIMSRSVMARLAGQRGDTLSVVFRDGQDQDRELPLVLGAARGMPATLGNLPEVRVWTNQKIIDGRIGYFGFNYFLDVVQVMGDFNQAMNDFRDLPGVIIDLRGNPGGLGAMAMGMAGWFVKDKGLRLGTMIMRTGKYNFSINTRAHGYNGLLAVLVDDLSASTSEIMAGGLQDLHLARIFGSRTAGAALPSNIIKLPNGDGFQFAIANYVSQGGAVLEGVGVMPDQPVTLTRENLLAEGDPVLKAARSWLLSQPTAKD